MMSKCDFVALAEHIRVFNRFRNDNTVSEHPSKTTIKENRQTETYKTVYEAVNFQDGAIEALTALVDKFGKERIAEWLNVPFTSEHLSALAMFCKEQNGNFMRDRWLEYIAGNCGKNGGSLKKAGTR